jgi:hypothetical protein
MIKFARKCVTALALCIAFGSCVTTHQSNPAYQKDGIQYGETKGQFRGRWWNYYERGQSFLQGEFFAEAERDFRIALRNRSQDQRWARTYGLHFLPEYFPNRELGITLYQQGRMDEATESIEESLDQQHTARGAYYLGLVRRAQVEAAGSDREAPTFQVAEEGLARGELKTTLNGTALDDTYVSAIWINEEPYPIDLSAPIVEINHPVTLQAGANQFHVAVEDILGNRSEFDIQLHTDVDGPLVSFDAASNNIITGVLYDASGVASLSFGEIPASLTPQDDGTVKFRADLPPSSAQVIEYVCADEWDNETKGAVPATALPASAAFRRTRVAQAAVDPAVDASLNESAPIILAQQSSAFALAAPTAKINNPTNGRVYLRDEIVVDIELRSGAPLQLAVLNGYEIPLIQGRSSMLTSRKLLLPDTGSHTVTLALRDERGQEAITSVEVERRASKIEDVGRLDAAFLGMAPRDVEVESDIPIDAYLPIIKDYIYTEFFQSERFANIVDRDEAALSAILTEQQLSASLGDKDEVLALHQVIPAELLVAGKFRRYPDSIEITLEGKSTEVLSDSGVITLGLAEVSGAPTTNEEYRDLVHILVLRFLEQFPQAQGGVLAVRGDKLITDLSGITHALKTYHKVIVYRKGEPIYALDDPNEIAVGGETEILGEGIISKVDGSASEVVVVTRSPDFETIPIERGHIVVTK